MRLLLVPLLVLLAGCTPVQNGTEMPSVIPAPVSIEVHDGWQPATEPVLSTDAALPAEGYRLAVDAKGIRIQSADAAGAFYAQQTLAQLTVDGRVPNVSIDDHPRFAYRGAMLDVARHFFPVESVKRYVDDIALLKLNHLHLHLTDDQGWRLAIDGWPRLTEIGASTQVGGGGGGFYTQADYTEIVDYAAARFVTIVPEIDMPGHTNAAISAYPELGDLPVEPYEGIEVGFSSFAIRDEATYAFIDDVVRQVSALTPGPYLHLGGDESLATTDEDFLYFIERATGIAAQYGKTLIGWHEMGRSTALPAGTVGQYWNYTRPEESHGEHTLSFVEQGGQVIMSPANVAYLDMQYPETDRYGLVWAQGPTSVREAYEWDPAEVIDGVTDAQLLGVEAPIWAETLTTIDEVEFMAFPRIAAIAEKAWSPAGGSWSDFATRLPAFGVFLDSKSVNYYRTAEVSWIR